MRLAGNFGRFSDFLTAVGAFRIIETKLGKMRPIMKFLWSRCISPRVSAGFRPCLRLPSLVRPFHSSRHKLKSNTEQPLVGKNPIIKVSEEIQEALTNGAGASMRPVVALESAIYTHGLQSFLRSESYILQRCRVPLP